MNFRKEQEVYKQKYLKYKTKYLEAKNNLEGGVKCGKYIYFLDFPHKVIELGNEIMQKIIDEFVKVISPENDGDKVAEKINEICRTINFQYKLVNGEFNYDDNHAVRCAYIEISSTGVTFNMHKINHYRNDDWVKVDLLTKGTKENENGEINTDFLYHIHIHYPFNY